MKKSQNGNMIYFSSDFHWNHKNIVRGCSTWKQFTAKSDSGIQQLRDFDTLEKHNQKLIDNINSVVGQDDTLYHLGDWSFGGIESIWHFRKKIVCKNIHSIIGNHDKHIEKNNQITIPKEERELYDHLTGFSANSLNNGIVDIHSLFSSVSHYKEITIEGQLVILCHYAMRVWNRSHKGSIMLYGHSHGSLESCGKSMDVGVDTNNLMPYSWDNILKKMNKIDIKVTDHHSV